MRGERENRKIGYAVFYEDLVHQVPFRDRPRRHRQAQAAPASDRRLSRVLGTHMGSATELFCGTEGPDRSSRSVCLLGETTYVSMTVG
jgi:hypothetical protein